MFISNLSILLNGYPIKETSIQKGLMQEDPLAPNFSGRRS